MSYFRPITTHGRISSLDGLRAISVLFVIIGHFQPGYLESQLGALGKGLNLLFARPALGVNIFFVLSGFIITELLLKEKAQTGEINLKGFFFRRVFRIIPAFYFYLSFVVILACMGDLSLTFKELLNSALFLRDYIPGANSWGVTHSWSLGVEEKFYLFYPWIIKKFDRKQALQFTLIIIAFSPLLRILTHFSFPENRPDHRFMFHNNMDLLMFGCAGSLWLSLKKDFSERNFLLNGYTQSFLIFFVLWLSPAIASRLKGAYLMTLEPTLEGLCIILFLIWVTQKPSLWVKQLLNMPFLVRIGLLSYSLYLWQQLFTRSHFRFGFFTSVPFNFLLCWLCAEISYNCIEQPFLRIRKLCEGRFLKPIAN